MKKLGKVLAAAVAALSMGLVFMGCPTSTPTVTGITFGEDDPWSDSTKSDPYKLTTNVSKAFSVTVLMSDGNNVTYEDDDLIDALDEDVITLKYDTDYLKVKNNKITGIKTCTAENFVTLTIKYGGCSKKAYFYVQDGESVVLNSDLTVKPTAASIAIGETTTYELTAVYSDGSKVENLETKAKVAYSQSGIATASAGTITGVAAGSTVITFTYTDSNGDVATAKITVTVTDPSNTLVSIKSYTGNSASIPNKSSAAFKVVPTYSSTGAGDSVIPELSANDTNATKYASIDGNTITNLNNTESSVTASFVATYSGKTCIISVTLAGASSEGDDDDEGSGSITIDFNN